jgi:hypothetical protein
MLNIVYAVIAAIIGAVNAIPAPPAAAAPAAPAGANNPAASTGQTGQGQMALEIENRSGKMSIIFEKKNKYLGNYIPLGRTDSAINQPFYFWCPEGARFCDFSRKRGII